jgi:hypothetical protein
MRHYPGAESLKDNDMLLLERQPDNAHDRDATAILTEDKVRVGYVPRQYARAVARLLDSGVALSAEALRRLTDPADGGRWLVRIARP